MPKILDYPRASLKNALEFARTVDSLGGECSLDTAADKSGRKLGGAFAALVSSAAKYDLVSVSKGRVSTTDLFREYRLAYSPVEELKALRKAFLSIPIFAEICARLAGKELPIKIFDRFLMKEFQVQDTLASRVSGYFLEGARSVGLLEGDRLVDEFQESQAETVDSEADEEASASVEQRDPPETRRLEEMGAENQEPIKSYQVRITGPGMDSVLQIAEPEDLEIVEIMLRKVAKKISSLAENKKPSNEEGSSDG